ncbi:MAG TPA: methyltransferase domain-containing protein [Nitrososphaeraceae archaeon]|nr:methyltransferase domain-containing protein [Nitrososphaeraceae archaeon]
MIVNEIEKDLVKPKRIIDLGCGNGRNSLFLARKYGSEVVLVDYDKSMLDWAVKLCRQYEINFSYIHEKLENIACNNHEVIKKDERYDIVILSYVLQHIDPVYYPIILDFCKGMCGGYFLVDVFWNPCRCRPHELISLDTINWYGLTYDELVSFIAPRFKILRERIVTTDSNMIINILSKEGVTSLESLDSHHYSYDYTHERRPIRKRMERRNKIDNVCEMPFIKSLYEMYPSRMDIVLKEIREWSNGQLGNSSPLMAAKILWLCRCNRVPVYLEEVLDGFSITLKHIRKILTDAEYIPPLRASDYISRIEKLLGLPTELVKDAQTIADQIKVVDGSSPRVVAGYSIIKAASEYGTDIALKKVAQALRISSVALRHYQSRIESS